MTQMIFVNLPVKDLEVSKAFFTKLGYTVNAQFTDENASSIVISDTIVVMLLKEDFFKTFTTRTIADTATTVESITCLSAESREAVDTLVDTALSAGGSAAQEPQDHGFMYGRSFLDPDGHHWEVMWMDPAAIQG
ncbi:VOC family protein [Streptomyces sp. NPDC050738]|uniref:VOC family protein n=1 Tax=Streptomyces sp. NPDC050738 TaxID=3154744 RepID=UPI003429F377